jgi:putative Holliday junction resolvase
VVANGPSLGNAKALRAGLARGRRLLGLDPGARRIGLALSDVALTIASPAGTIPRGKLTVVAAALAPLIAREGVGGLVIGLPLAMDGAFGPAAQAARDFGRDLAARLDLPWAMMDERLSSEAARRALIAEADLSRARQAALVDGIAAAWMLQAFLDSTKPG